MKEPIEIIIYKSGLKLCHPSDCSIYEHIGKEEKNVLPKIADFVQRVGAASAMLHLFVAEELLYFKSFQLPLDTPDLDEAVGYQLEALTPFADEATWHGFEAVRGDDSYKVSLFAAQSRYIDVYVQEIVDAGYQMSGLFPECLRYVNKLNRKDRWGLLLPGRFYKAFVYEGSVIESRYLCSAQPDFAEAVEVCKTDRVYKVDPETQNEQCDLALMPDTQPFFDFVDGRFLLSQRPFLKSHNMLPASYQRPDYTKIVIAVLLILNLVTLLAFGGIKAYQLVVWDDQIDQQIESIMPMVNEMKDLRRQEEKYMKAIAQMQNIGKNTDFIDFVTRLTESMPTTSFVDQMRLDPKENSIHIQGYTDDISELTTRLQEIGDTQLRSTSRRKNKTYYHVEMRLP